MADDQKSLNNPRLREELMRLRGAISFTTHPNLYDHIAGMTGGEDRRTKVLAVIALVLGAYSAFSQFYSEGAGPEDAKAIENYYEVMASTEADPKKREQLRTAAETVKQSIIKK